MLLPEPDLPDLLAKLVVVALAVGPVEALVAEPGAVAALVGAVLLVAALVGRLGLLASVEQVQSQCSS